MRRSILALAAAVAVAPAAVQANGLELSLSDDIAEIGYIGETDALGMGRGQVFGSVLFNNDDDIIGSVGLRSINRVSPSLNAFVGVKGYAGKLDDIDQEIGAIGIGAGVGVGLASQIPLQVVGSVHWAPSILSFADADGVQEFEVRLEGQLTPTAAAFIGYRWLEIELDDWRRDYEPADEVLFGVRLGF